MSDKTYTQEQVNHLVDNMREFIQTNAGSNQTLRNQMASVMSGGYDYSDTLHNVYLDYGYPAVLSFFNYWNMYRRFGIAARVIELYPDQTWLDDPIVEGSKQFNKELDQLIGSFGVWRRMKGLDKRQRVGRYGGLFMRVRDNKKPDEPIDGKLNGLASLVDMVPLYESQLEVTETQQNIMADDYGQPSMYQFNAGDVGNRNEHNQQSYSIHPSRVIIASEGSDNSNIYGIPAMENTFNSLMDLRKIIGAGGEGFYKNAAQSVLFNLQDASTAKANAELLGKFNDEFNEFTRSRFNKGMWTPGMDVNTLSADLADPSGHFANALSDVSAGSGIPTSLLIGNQTGRLAGDQDTEGFLSQVQSRRTDFGSDIVTRIIDWCTTNGILPKSEYEIEWPDALAPSNTEKLVNADKMSEVNSKVFLSGGSPPPFTSEEIREAAGFDPNELTEDDLPNENDIDDEI